MPAFWDHQGLADLGKKMGWVDKHLKEEAVLLKLLLRRKDSVFSPQAAAELIWGEGGKVYYKLYPEIGKKLGNMSFKGIRLSSIRGKERSFLIRFREDDNNFGLKTILFAKISLFWCVVYDDGAVDKDKLPSRGVYLVEEDSEKEISEIKCLPMRLAIAVMLLVSNSDMVEKDVLGADRAKWEGGSTAERLICEERAMRRGKNGWNIGRLCEVDPHWRNPHPCIVRFGVGRTESKVIIRRGSIVHREKVVKMNN